MKNILIIYHSEGGIVEKMASSIKRGTENLEKDIQVELKYAQDPNWDKLKAAAGIAIGTPDYFDYMAGTVKDFFDRTYFPSQSKIKGSLVAGLPCVFFASGGTGGEPALESLEKIGKYFKFNIVDNITSGPELTPEIAKKCEKAGGKLGEAVLAGRNI